MNYDKLYEFKKLTKSTNEKIFYDLFNRYIEYLNKLSYEESITASKLQEHEILNSDCFYIIEPNNSIV